MWCFFRFIEINSNKNHVFFFQTHCTYTKHISLMHILYGFFFYSLNAFCITQSIKNKFLSPVNSVASCKKRMRKVDFENIFKDPHSQFSRGKIFRQPDTPCMQLHQGYYNGVARLWRTVTKSELLNYLTFAMKTWSATRNRKTFHPLPLLQVHSIPPSLITRSIKLPVKFYPEGKPKAWCLNRRYTKNIDIISYNIEKNLTRRPPQMHTSRRNYLTRRMKEWVNETYLLPSKLSLRPVLYF